MGKSAIDIIDELIRDAQIKAASDIHIDPMADAVVVKLRIDGRLIDQQKLPKNLHQEIIGRIKILSRLRTDEHYLPQDGRFTYGSPPHQLDIRLSIIPTYYGENAVLRLLQRTSVAHTLDSLGIHDSQRTHIERLLKKRNGMIIITGPTGSGKTTTLYSLIDIVARNRLVVTIEDPVEYALHNVRQIQVGTNKGLTFAHGLRSILRQDPDSIVVGEIRDAETARIAIHAALTGHLLLSTLHTNDSVSSLVRLIDMGVEPYLVASTVDLIIAQRLIRTICKECHGTLCEYCSYSGYKGRTGIYEVLEMNEDIRKMILERQPSKVIKMQAMKNGLITLNEDGERKIISNITTPDEVMYSLL